MTAQAPQNLAILDKTLPSFTAVAASDTIVVNTGYRYILVVNNGNASPDVVTLTPSGVDIFGRALPTKTISVTNGTIAYIYLPNQPNLADPVTGLITVLHSVTTTVTCAVIALPN